MPLAAVLALNASAAEMGVLGALTSLPNLLFSLHAGGLVDGYGRLRRLMIICDVGRGVALLTVPVAAALDSLTLIHLMTVAFVTGTLAMLFNVASYSMFTTIVEPKDFMQGNSLTRGSFSFSWVAGPGLGGLLVQVLTAPIALLVDVVSYFCSAFLLSSISLTEPEPETDKSKSHIRDGLRFVARTDVLRAKFISGGTLNLFYSMYFTLFLLFIAREAKLSPGLIGLALGLGAIGALLGSFVASATSRRLGVGMTLVIGTVLFPGALALVPLATTHQWVAFSLVVGAEILSGLGSCCVTSPVRRSSRPSPRTGSDPACRAPISV